MIGKNISHYKILEEVGRGGMGVVYKAEDTKLKRTVALKFLPPELTRDPEAKQRFTHEAQAASALDHNNICTIHEIDETDDGQMFIAMAYYEGETLKDKIERGPLNLEKAIDFSKQIADGLNEAHKKGIIHRDIKPVNIMITDKGQVKIMDFGLAKLHGRSKLTREGTTLGTVSYMSPEQTRGEEVDQRTDIWSLGVVLYEMITGQLPFKGEYEQAIIYSIMNESPEPLTALRSGLPMEMERMINKCLTKIPDERYQHADELAVDLQKFQRELELSKKTPAAKAKKLKSPQRQIKRSGLFVGILLAVIVGITTVYILSERIAKTKKPVETTLDQTDWENSIAVLPVKNISSDLEQEYFCDGMTEQIISNLSRLQRLKVIARTSVMKFKDSDKTISEIGKELNVAYVLESSVRKFGARIRLTAQLINTENSFHLWANDYDRELKDVFAVQDDISVVIAGALLEKLTTQETSDIRTNSPSNTEAYEYFLKAEFFHKKFYHTFQLEDFNTAEQLFKKAIESDPNYALSYAELANVYNTFFYYKANTKEDRQKYLRLQEKYIEQAVQLDPNSAEVLLLQSQVFRAKGEANKGFSSLRKALQIDPNHSASNFQMGVFLRNFGLIYHSFKFFNKAVELDPLEPWNYAGRGLAYYLTGEYDKATIDYQSALQIEPYEYETMGFYFILLIIMKKQENAKNLLVSFEKMYADDAQIMIFKAWLLAIKGEKENALKRFEQSKGGTSGRIILYLILDLKDEALELMKQRQITEKDFPRSRYLEYKNLQWFDKLREDEVFKEILSKEEEKYEIILEKYGM